MIYLVKSKRNVLRFFCWTARLSKDRRGVAAVEFAFIAPILLALFFGMVELTGAIEIKRKVTAIARTVSDLTSQAGVVTDADLSNFFAASSGIMMPYDTTPISITVSLLYVDPSSGQVRVEWSKGYNTAAISAGTPVSIPGGLISRDSNNQVLANQYLIYSHVSYLYTNATLVVLKSGVSLTDDSYTRPRQKSCVFYPSIPSTNICPTA